jgi:phospholipase/carboxylesterase
LCSIQQKSFVEIGGDYQTSITVQHSGLVRQDALNWRRPKCTNSESELSEDTISFDSAKTSKTVGTVRKWIGNILFVILGGFAVYYCFQIWPTSPYPEMGEYVELDELSLRLSGASLQKADMVVVFLHGANGNAFGSVDLGRIVSPNRKTCFVSPNGPIQIRGEHRAWYGRNTKFSDSKTKIPPILRWVKKQNPDAKIVLGGFSQGAILTTNLIQEVSQLVDAFVVLSPSGWLEQNLASDKVQRRPIFYSHGILDKGLPFEKSKRLCDRFIELGYPVQWYEYNDGHVMPDELKFEIKSFLGQVASGQ